MFTAPPSAPLATWSPCKLYRYTLRRTWAPTERFDGAFMNGLSTLLREARGLAQGDRKLVTWVLLNPSTADETHDDPTIRRCIDYSKSWGYDGLIIVNAYGLRSTDPKGLWKVQDPNGPENDAALLGACREASRVVCGWGANLRNDRRDSLSVLLQDIELSALKINANGSPAHPLYQRSDALPSPFSLKGVHV